MIHRICRTPSARAALGFSSRLALLLAFVLGTSSNGSETAPSFRNEVLPILSQAGCNSGGCHGALAGKGGFRLSLFGYDPKSDYLAITRDLQGRRVELSDPGRSLFLIKPTTAVKHQGGKRLDVDSEDYRILADWISAGCPPPRDDDPRVVELEVSPSTSRQTPGQELQLSVKATYSDGSERDVTRWTKFTSTDETIASVDRSGSVQVVGSGVGAITAWFSSRIAIARVTAPYSNSIPAEVFERSPSAGLIDELVLEQLRELNLKPSDAASDATFIRRAYLDTIGKLPTPEETRAFTSDTSPGKYKRLADLLLARPEYIDYWSYLWSELLLVTGSKLRPEPLNAYYQWIRDRVAENTPWNDLVRRVVTSRGSAVEEGASNFYAVHQDPESMAENVSQAFLSLSINCAKCHNHPLEKWTNDQYYSFANLFSRVRAKGWGGDPRNGNGHRTVYVEPSGDLIQPRTGMAQPPAPLDEPPIATDDPRDRREVLAQWLTSPDNPYFARAIVNRVWAHFMGVGLVEPVDDLRVSNPARNEKLLDGLAHWLVSQNYDLKKLMSAILNSHTYRRSSEAMPENQDDRRYYSRYYPRRLMAEVLNDAISDVTGVGDQYTEIALNDGSTEKTTLYPAGTRALQLRDAAVKSYFLKAFGRSQREITCECERSNQPSLIQVLHLSNGSTVNEKLADRKSRITRILAVEPSPAEILDEAWMRCLSRSPTPAEKEKFETILATAPPEQKRQAVEDLYWSLLTTREFLFQH